MKISAQKGFTLWFTGLPCAGKTTLACAVERRLKAAGRLVEHLDGDTLRRTVSKDLGFSKKDRDIHLKRAARMAAFMNRDGVITLVSLISPYRKTRQVVRRSIGDFVEVYARCPLKVCEKRDVKGMYRLARAGRLKHFTGISDPYEKPMAPEITVLTDQTTVEACTRQIMDYLARSGWIGLRTADPGKAAAKKLQSQIFPPKA